MESEITTIRQYLQALEEQLAADPENSELNAAHTATLLQLQEIEALNNQLQQMTTSPEGQLAAEWEQIQETNQRFEEEENELKQLQEEVKIAEKQVLRKSFSVDLCLVVSMRPQMKQWIKHISEPANMNSLRTAVSGVDKRAIIRWGLFAYPGNMEEDPFFVVPFSTNVAQFRAGVEALSSEMAKNQPCVTNEDDISHVLSQIIGMEWEGMTRVIIHLTATPDVSSKKEELKAAALNLASHSISYYLGATAPGLETIQEIIAGQYEIAAREIDFYQLQSPDEVVYYIEDAIKACVGQCRSFAVPM